MQVSQYTFAMCSYREKKSEPQEFMQLEGYTVDYTDPHPGNSKLNYFPLQSCIPEILINVLCLFHMSKLHLVNRVHIYVLGQDCMRFRRYLFEGYLVVAITHHFCYLSTRMKYVNVIVAEKL